MPKRILFVNPFGIGDVIFTLPLVREIRRQDPEAFIGFVCNERTFELVRMAPEIDKTVIFNRDRFRKLWRKHPFLFYKKIKAMLSLLKEDRYDTLADLSLGREAGFFGRWIGIRNRVGFDYRGRGFFLTRKITLTGYEDRPVSAIQMDLLEPLGFQKCSQVPGLDLRVSEASRIAAWEFLKRSGIGAQDTLLTVAPGGGRSWGAEAVYKQWDPACFVQAAAGFSQSHRPNARVLVLGDRAEEPLLRHVASRIGARAVVAAGLSIEEAAALLLRSRALLCNDGGLLHLADALNVPTVSVFGPVDEKVYGPQSGASAKREVLTEPVDCRPCYRRFHFPPCAHHRRCLTGIPAERAIEALKKIA